MFANSASKRRLVSGKTVPITTYESMVQILPKEHATKVSNGILAVAWGPSFALKAKELVYTNVLAAHAFHCYWASVYTCFRDLGRMFSRTPRVASQFVRVLKLRESNPLPCLSQRPRRQRAQRSQGARRLA